MSRRISLACLCLAFAPLSPLWAEAPSGPVSPTPYVKSAVIPPSNVELPDVPNPAVQLRLEDPAKGGVLSAGCEGIALLPGPTEESFTARVEIEFLEANTSVEIRVIDADGAQLNFLVISSPVPSRWSGDLAEVKASQNSRVELSVKTGSALGTAYRVGRVDVTTIPILNRAEVKAAGGGTLALSTARPSARTSLSPGPGYSNYTRNYSWPGTNVSYVVTSGPHNTCGDIHTFRNGSWVIAGGWLCTDSTGYGKKGPWYITTTFPGQDQTDNPSYIKWPDQTVTTSTWSVIDVTKPTVVIYHDASFAGTASDGQWGSGFSKAWNTQVLTWYKDETAGGYWGGSCQPTGYNCYGSAFPVYYPAQTNLPSQGIVFQLQWLIPFGWVTCDPGHQCSVNVSVNDVWSTGTQKWIWSH